ncbi:MAG TPA: glycerol-3-phosphate acyltransferase, partial [Terriglobales bacterium]|nr:glycerol-3-phosphate acyltransferase [Terriglobales bacterium]
MLVFIIMLAAFRFVSLASVTAAAFLPLFSLILREAHSTQIGTIAISSALIILKHRPNMQRLLSATEPKFKAHRK